LKDDSKNESNSDQSDILAPESVSDDDDSETWVIWVFYVGCPLLGLLLLVVLPICYCKKNEKACYNKKNVVQKLP